MTGTADSKSNVVLMNGVTRIASAVPVGKAIDAKSIGQIRRDNDDELWTRLEHKLSERDAEAHKESQRSERKSKSWLWQIFKSIGL